MREDKRNFVVSIQPQGHEFEGVLKIISNLKKGSEQGHLIESVWKFLIYTEIGRQFLSTLIIYLFTIKELKKKIIL